MRFLKIGLIVCSLFVAGTTFWVVQKQRTQDVTLPVYGALDSFQLVDQQSSVFDSSSLKGHVSIVNFIFTSCPHVCPLLTRQMAKIQEKTKEMGKDVQLISISVDPEKDTPATLQEYGKRYGANFERWAFLTGPIETIRRVVVKGFMNAMGENKSVTGETPDLFEVTHGENFVVLDKNGAIRAFRQAKSERDIHEILKIVRQLNAEEIGTPKTATWGKRTLRTAAAD